MSTKQSAKMPRRKGCLIAIEGIDGSGKTTQARMLVESLQQKGYQSIYLFEPTNGKYGLQLRRQAQTGRVSARKEFELFLRDRQEDARKNILPALAQGKIVVIDRYYYSSMAYQGARGLDPEMIRQANEKIAPRADLVLYLKLPVKTGVERITQKRNAALDQFEAEEYQRRVARIYQEMSRRLPEFRTVDASGDAKQINRRLLRKVSALIKRGK